MITQGELKSLLHYNPETGTFTWVASPGRAKAGDEAGCLNQIGYVCIRVQQKLYTAHRLAFLYMTGSFPPNDTDHINGVRDDNRWDNLRAVTSSENRKNTRIAKNNSSGVLGVHWYKRDKKWHAQITTGRKRKHLGYFDTIEAATAARALANIQYGFHENHGRNVP